MPVNGQSFDKLGIICLVASTARTAVLFNIKKMNKPLLHSIIAFQTIICVALIIWIVALYDQTNSNNSCKEKYTEIYNAYNQQQQALAKSNETINQLKQLNDDMISDMELISKYVDSYRMPSYPRNVDCSPTSSGGINCHSY